jgi:hypothetical protein
MATIEKIQYSLDDLNLFEKRVNEGMATADEFMKIDKYIYSVSGVQDLILSKIKEEGMNSYEEYVTLTNKGKNNSRVLGTTAGVIAALKKLLTNNLH